ncbi:MAG: urease accessory protein UreE [Planctomycetota bacterium]
MLNISRILGHASDPTLAARLTEAVAAGVAETVSLDSQDTPRRRMRVSTDRGTECLIALPRDQRLSDGAILVDEPGRVVVVRLERQRWLTLEPTSMPAALQVGYFCGNMHWRVRFHAGLISVAMQSDRSDYVARVAHLVADGIVRVLPEDPDDATPLDAAEDIPPHDHVEGHTHHHHHGHDYHHAGDHNGHPREPRHA